MIAKPEQISVESFKPYGKVIEYPNKDSKGKKRNLWKILHRVDKYVGWRVAVLVLRDRSIGRMECHPTSDETFEPMNGGALIFVSNERSFDKIKCFYLNRPIILNQGIWHALMTIDPETEIKITENNRISCRYWPFGFRVKSFQDFLQRQKES